MVLIYLNPQISVSVGIKLEVSVLESVDINILVSVKILVSVHLQPRVDYNKGGASSKFLTRSSVQRADISKIFLCCQCRKAAVGDRGEIFLSSWCQKVVLGVDKEEGGEKEQILDPIYINFLSFKKGVQELILTCSFLHHAFHFNSEPYARAQIAATMPTWTLNLSSSTMTYIYIPHSKLPLSFWLG